MEPFHAIDQVVVKLRERFGEAPASAVVLGSGLGGLLGRLEDRQEAAYPELGLPKTSAPGHAGTLSLGQMGGKRVALLSGRLHLYEGHAIQDVVLPVRALARWGVKKLVLTSAVGGITSGLRVGDLVRVTDHINLLGINPLTGPNIDALGPRFPDLTRAYDPALGLAADRMAGSLRVPLRHGVYALMSGPSYETPAEIRMLRTIGADVVGMSTVPEVIAGVHAGLSLLVFAVVSNLAAGLSGEALSHEEVTQAADVAGPVLASLIEALVATW